MLWKTDPNIEAARKLEGWREFHRQCGKDWLYFDRMVREGRRYKCDAYTIRDRAFVPLATGEGSTVLDSIGDALEKSGRATDQHRSLFACIGKPAVVDEFEELL